MEFKPAKLDTTALLISIVTTVFLVLFSMFFILRQIPYGWIFAVLMVGIPFVSYLLSPGNYYIQGGNFVIQKVCGRKIVIPLNDIENIIPVQDFCKLKPVRSMGNGGLFGYYGIFTTKDYGNINCQLTRMKNIVLIKTRTGFYAISPAKPEMLIDWLKSTTGKSSMTEPITAPEIIKKRASFLTLLIPDTIFTLTIVMAVLLYQQLPEQIATHFDIHGNPDGWSPKVSFLYFTIFPQVILMAIAVITFFITRNRYRNEKSVYLLVMIISLIQFFVAYSSFDIYWFNTRNAHFVPMMYAVAVFTGLLILLLITYNKFLTKN